MTISKYMLSLVAVLMMVFPFSAQAGERIIKAYSDFYMPIVYHQLAGEDLDYEALAKSIRSVDPADSRSPEQRVQDHISFFKESAELINASDLILYSKRAHFDEYDHEAKGWTVDSDLLSKGAMIDVGRGYVLKILPPSNADLKFIPSLFDDYGQYRPIDGQFLLKPVSATTEPIKVRVNRRLQTIDAKVIVAEITDVRYYRLTKKDPLYGAGQHENLAQFQQTIDPMLRSDVKGFAIGENIEDFEKAAKKEFGKLKIEDGKMQAGKCKDEKDATLVKEEKAGECLRASIAADGTIYKIDYRRIIEGDRYNAAIVTIREKYNSPVGSKQHAGVWNTMTFTDENSPLEQEKLHWDYNTGVSANVSLFPNDKTRVQVKISNGHLNEPVNLSIPEIEKPSMEPVKKLDL